MFDNDAIARLRDQHGETLQQVVAVEQNLVRRFYGMDKTIRCMMLASLTGEPMVLLGPPGTAKSRLIRSYAHLLGLVGDDALSISSEADAEKNLGEAYFEYLLTQFTEPSELFGFYDLAKLFGEEKTFERAQKNMMQKAHVVFLDEVFNASSAILNALLTFMNERKFHDRGKIQKVPMRLLFGASNHTPREEGLGAFYDRFLLRSRVANVAAEPEKLADLVGAAWQETHATPVGDLTGGSFRSLLSGLDGFRAGVDEMTRSGDLAIDTDSPLFAKLADMIDGLRRKDLSDVSNRRLVKFTGVMLANAVLRAEREGETAAFDTRDLAVLLDYGLDSEDESSVRQFRDHLA